jgi:hypothetical protein
MMPLGVRGQPGRKVLVALCAGAVVFGLPRVASSACPAPGSICDAYEQATLVFVAEVEAMQPQGGPMRSGTVTRVTFRILEWFKGTAGKQVDLDLNPSSEEFPYVKDQRVLVYARRFGEAWSTACTRTRQVSPTDTELQAVRALRGNDPGGVIEGSLATSELLRSGRAGGIVVVLRRDGVVVSETKTDFAGRFQTGWLAPGVYELSVKATGATPGIPRKVVVSRESGCILIGSIAKMERRGTPLSV